MSARREALAAWLTETDTLLAQLDRLNADLAPLDTVRVQAEQTARLRSDPAYVARWEHIVA